VRIRRSIKLGSFLFLFLPLLFDYFCGGKEPNGYLSIYSNIDKANGYLIPFLGGQGLNNQLWEYRSAAIVAKATNRILCLEPFHRFYLQKTGRKFIPFEDLFDTESLKPFTRVASSAECAQKCNKVVHRHLELILKETSKYAKKKQIADWRPGSLKLFYESTGFQYLPLTEFININATDQGVTFDSLEDIKKVLSPYVSDQCISVLGTTPVLSREFLEWSRVLKVNQNIKSAVTQIKRDIFRNKALLSIHWRFEETKCAGFGRGIGFGRSIGVHRSTIPPVTRNQKVRVRKSDDHADLCFFAGPLPSKLASRGIWLRLVSKVVVVKWIRRIMKERNIENVYIATDCSDQALLQWIKLKTGAITKSNIEPLLSRFVSLEENDVVSRIEQQLCTESSVFMGTSMSSWTSSVVEERFNQRETFFIQNKYNITRRPDPMNSTFYFDIEVCNCEWKL